MSFGSKGKEACATQSLTPNPEERKEASAAQPTQTAQAALTTQSALVAKKDEEPSRAAASTVANSAIAMGPQKVTPFAEMHLIESLKVESFDPTRSLLFF